MEFRFCSLLHPHTVSAVITFRSLFGAQWQRDWVGHSLTLVSASCRLREETEISPFNTPLYPDNPSIICSIACYLYDNLCLIFQPFNLKKKGSVIEGIWLYGVFYFSTVVKFIFFSFYLGHQTSQPTESNYIGENINPIKKVKEIKEINCASKGTKLWCKYPDIDSYRHFYILLETMAQSRFVKATDALTRTWRVDNTQSAAKSDYKN